MGGKHRARRVWPARVAVAGLCVTAVTGGVGFAAYTADTPSAPYAAPGLVLPSRTTPPLIRALPTTAPITATTPAPPPPVVTTTRRAAPPKPSPPKRTTPPPPPADLCSSSGFGGVKPWVARAGHHIQDRFGVDTVYGLSGGSVSGSLHPLGLALDFMVYTDRALGDRIADYLLDNRERLGVREVIWRQRVNYGDGWQAMSDRGTPTANHMDHPHASFLASAPSGIEQLTC